MTDVPIVRRALAAGTGKVLWDVASRSLSFALTIFIARRLGAAGYGTFAVYWYAAFLLSQATDLGLHLTSLRSIAREGIAVFWSAVAAKALLTVGSAVLLGALAAGSSGWLLVSLAPLFVAQLVGSWVEFFGVVLRSAGSIAREGLVLATLRLSWLAGALWSLSETLDPSALGSALALSSLPPLALALLLVRRVLRGNAPPARTLAPSDARQLLRDVLPLAAGSILTLLYLRADLWIVAFLRGAEEAGIFQSAFRLFEASFVLSGAVAAGTFPVLAARIGRPRFEALSRFVLILLLALAGPLAGLFALAGEPLVTLVYGAGFAEAREPLVFLGLALVAVFVNALTTHLLVASGRMRLLVGALAVRLVLGVALDLLLVPAHGAVGAAMAVAAAEWCLLAVSLAASADLLGWSALVSRVPAREGVS